MFESKNSHFIKALNIVKNGNLSVQQLQNILNNAKAGNKGISDVETEILSEQIEFAMRKADPKRATKILGPVNRKTREQLDKFRVLLEKKHPEMATKNKHKSHVKVGGNVIRGDAVIYDYISFKGENNLISQIAISQLSGEDVAKVLVSLTKYERKNSVSIEEYSFPLENFDEAKVAYEEVLKKAML